MATTDDRSARSVPIETKGSGSPRTVASTVDLPPGGRKFVTVDGVDVALLNVDGEYYAIENVCPHAQRPVGSGRVAESSPGRRTIECPFHNWTFDLASGQRTIPSRSLTKYLDTYEVSIVGGGDPNHHLNGFRPNQRESTMAADNHRPGVELNRFDTVVTRSRLQRSMTPRERQLICASVDRAGMDRLWWINGG